MAVLLENPVRSYAWGSPTVIPELLGQEPTGDPQAELWVGAHPGSPSVVAGDGRTLVEYVAADPAGMLGANVVDRFGARLPYLLKILAVERPISIQAHPTVEQAERGYAAEDAAGIALDSPKRSYRDRNHKPEMVVALTDFEALLGFRDPTEVASTLEGTGRGEFDDAVATLRRDDGLRELVAAWLTLPEAEAGRLVGVLVGEASTRRHVDPFAVVAQLASEYPGDRGLLLALLLRRVRLSPGEAAYVAAGDPHAYLSGVAVEPQASSDNTLRAGLTRKHVDVAEIQRVLRYEPGGGLLVEPAPAGPGEQLYPVSGLDEFRLCRLELSRDQIRPSGAGPRIVLVVDGYARIATCVDAPAPGSWSGRSDPVSVPTAPRADARPRPGSTSSGPRSETLELQRGQAAFVSASESDVTITGDGVAFTITPNLARPSSLSR